MRLIPGIDLPCASTVSLWSGLCTATLSHFGVRMISSKSSPKDACCLCEHLFRLCCLVHVPQEQCYVEFGNGHVRVIVAVHGYEHLFAFLMLNKRLFVFALTLQYVPNVSVALATSGWSLP